MLEKLFLLTVTSFIGFICTSTFFLSATFRDVVINNPNPQIVLPIISSSQTNNNQTQQYIPLILMTFNVQFYKTSQTTQPIATFIIDHQPDVVGLQENIYSHDWTGKKLAPLDLNTSYILAGECQAEKVSGYHLSNTIYIHQKHRKHVQQLSPVNLRLTNETVRCAAVIRLYDTTIANLHLCGGRFDDKKFHSLQEHKHLQLKRLIDMHNPDIIMGDFNNENSDEVVMKQLNQYKFYQSLNKNDQILFVHYFMSGAHYLRSQTKYIPAYNESSIGETSAYGGTPDWIYVKDRTRLTGKIDNYDAITTNLSDHNAVIAEYLFTNLKRK